MCGFGGVSFPLWESGGGGLREGGVSLLFEEQRMGGFRTFRRSMSLVGAEPLHSGRGLGPSGVRRIARGGLPLILNEGGPRLSWVALYDRAAGKADRIGALSSGRLCQGHGPGRTTWRRSVALVKPLTRHVGSAMDCTRGGPKVCVVLHEGHDRHALQPSSVTLQRRSPSNRRTGVDGGEHFCFPD